jgi:hypothetical protein
MSELPRSLDPLPEESLPGYLLRLSYRLKLAPAYLIRRVGLKPVPTNNNSPRDKHLMVELNRPAATAFAQATRLSLDEITALTLVPWRLHYPPVAASMRPSRTRTDPWLFTSASRYCPVCLAGDGSQLQHQLGGAWKKSWRLPVAFTCTEHQIFLRHQCPGCHRPANDASASAARLLIRGTDSSLHPAQCRNSLHRPDRGKLAPACAHRLDGIADDQFPVPSAGLAAFQTRILDLLDPHHPAEPAARYFTDLRLITALIRTSWPQARNLMEGDLVEATERHLDNQERQQPPADTKRRLPITMVSPPLDAMACAALLHTADTVLNAPNLRDALAPLIASTRGSRRRSPWTHAFIRNEDGCSQHLRQATEPLVRAFRRTGGRPQGTKAPVRTGGFQPEHIAAYLQQDWHDKHFSGFVGINIKILRRTAAVRLVQMVAGGSLGDAAEFLGINPDGTQYKQASDVRLWGDIRPNQLSFETALHTLADELNLAGKLVDYDRRRTALRDWFLDEITWQRLISQLPPIPGPVQPVLDDRKRQDASIFIWTRITQGEHLFAPHPIETHQPLTIQDNWARRRNTTWFQLTRPDPLRHYTDLRNLLISHAQQLAASIDSAIR